VHIKDHSPAATFPEPMNTYITTSFIKRLSSTTWLLRLRGLLLRLRLLLHPMPKYLDPYIYIEPAPHIISCTIPTSHYHPVLLTPFLNLFPSTLRNCVCLSTFLVKLSYRDSVAFARSFLIYYLAPGVSELKSAQTK
jgi:hypothetical protein